MQEQLSVDQYLKVLSDLQQKMHTDIIRVIDPTLNMIKDVVGTVGVYALVQKTANSFVHGAAMALAAMRSEGKSEDPNNDDILYAGLVAILSGEAHTGTKPPKGEMTERAAELFRSIRGYDYASTWEDKDFFIKKQVG